MYKKKKKLWFLLYHVCLLFWAMNSFNVITNGLSSTKKQIKLIQYLKVKINKNGIVFFQETHSAVDDKIKS